MSFCRLEMAVRGLVSCEGGREGDGREGRKR